MELGKEFAKKYGQSNYNLFIYSRMVLIYCIHQNEVFDVLDINELRREYLKKAEIILRELLKKLAFEEELELLNYKLEL